MLALCWNDTLAYYASRMQVHLMQTYVHELLFSVATYNPYPTIRRTAQVIKETVSPILQYLKLLEVHASENGSNFICGFIDWLPLQ